MDPYRIPQTLIVAPEQSFEQLAGALGRLGFARDAAAAPAQPPLLPGEPELAGWSWHGDKPVITYSFNPVVRLRVLDVSTLPPQLRAAVAHSVPRVEPSQVPAWLRSDEARERLLAIFIARESERFELMGAVQQAAQDREVPVARAA
jgi:hypothetical protein